VVLKENRGVGADLFIESSGAKDAAMMSIKCQPWERSSCSDFRTSRSW